MPALTELSSYSKYKFTFFRGSHCWWRILLRKVSEEVSPFLLWPISPLRDKFGQNEQNYEWATVKKHSKRKQCLHCCNYATYVPWSAITSRSHVRKTANCNSLCIKIKQHEIHLFDPTHEELPSQTVLMKGDAHVLIKHNVMTHF